MAADPATLVPWRPVLVPLFASALAEVLAWCLALWPDTLAAGWYGRADLLVVVHLVTVGAAATAIVGAGWQLVPVITAMPWRPPAAAVSLTAGFGAVLALWGFGHPGWVGTLGAGLLVAALAVRAVVVGTALVRARGRGVTRGWLIAAEFCLLVGLGYAAGLWAGRLGHPVFADPIAAVGRHVGFLLAGWVGGSIVGFGSVLLPMFFVGPEVGARWLGLAGVLWFGGVALGLPWLWATGALVVAVVLLASLWRGLRRAFGQLAIGLAGLTSAALIAGVAGVVTVAGPGAGAAATAAAGPGTAPERVVAVLLTLFLLPIRRGMAQKIVPYLIWAHALPGAPVPAPPAFARFQPWISAVGAVLLVAGRTAGQPATGLGVALLLVGSLGHLAAIGVVAGQLALANVRRGALAGTESP